MPIITTTQTSSNYSIRPEMRFDTEYLRTIHGILKVILLVNCFKRFSESFCIIFSTLGSWVDQHNHHFSRDLVWCEWFFQLYNRYRLVVYSYNAGFVLVPRTWKVLHTSLASNWNRRDLSNLPALLHFFADCYFD